MNAATATTTDTTALTDRRRTRDDRRQEISLTGPGGVERRAHRGDRRGRPKLSNALRVKKTIRFSEEEAAQLAKIAAMNQHGSVTEFLREAAIEAIGDCTEGFTLRRPTRKA